MSPTGRKRILLAHSLGPGSPYQGLWRSGRVDPDASFKERAALGRVSPQGGQT